MKIAIITNTANSLLNFRKDFIIYLVENGFEVYGFEIDFDDDSINKLKKLGASPICYELARGGMNPFADIKNTIRLTRLIREVKPDIVFSTFAKPVIFGTLAAKRANVKKIAAMVEGLGYFFTEQPEGLSFKTRLVKKIQVFLYRIALPKVDKLLFLNKDDIYDLVEKNKIKTKSTKVLGAIGLLLSEYSFSPPIITSPVSFLFVGRLLKEKGIFEFLKAAEIVQSKYKDSRFYVIGDIDFENPGALKKEDLDDYVKRGIITYPGHVTNVAEWIKKSSVFVLPSYREGFPRSTQEAMAIGRAIITTNVPGCRETVLNGKNGFLISKWSVEELAEKMIHFINCPTDIVEMGIASHKIAKNNFDVTIINERLLDFILKD